MADTHQNRSKDDRIKKIDWKQKGLGWIPDYPDIRDYDLSSEDIQVNGKLNQSAMPLTITNSLEKLVEALGVFQSSSFTNHPYLDQQIQTLKDQLFGEIRFTTIRRYQSLREQSEDKPMSCTGSRQARSSEFSKQVHALKECFGILILQGYLPLDKDSVEKLLDEEKLGKNKSKKDTAEIKATLTAFNSGSSQPMKILEWFREDRYDPTTKFLVELFQKCVEIRSDGIVGFGTYTELKTYLSNTEELKKLKDKVNEIINAPVQDSEPEQKPPETKLISVPSLVPAELSKMILGELVRSASQGKNENLSELRLLQDLNQLEIPKLKSVIEQLNSNQKLYRDKGIEDSPKPLQELLKNAGLSDFEPQTFMEVFQNEFHTIEPIVSLAVKIVSPLAQYQEYRLEEVAEQSFVDLRKLFCAASKQGDQAQPETASETSQIGLNTQGMEDLAEAAFRKVTELMKTGLESLIDEHLDSGIQKLLPGKNRDNKLVRTFYFYYLVKQYLNQFITSERQKEFLQSIQPNVFDKQEVFELVELPEIAPLEVEIQQKTQAKQEKYLEQPELNLFPTLELKVPVSRKFYEAYKCQLEKSKSQSGKSKKPYLFLPCVVDLSYWASPIEDQGTLNACTAFAGIALMEYFTNKQNGKYTDLSPLFLYKVARNLLSLSGDVGSSVRATIKSMALFGVPPARLWDYDPEK